MQIWKKNVYLPLEEILMKKCSRKQKKKRIAGKQGQYMSIMTEDTMNTYANKQCQCKTYIILLLWFH